MGLFSHHDDDKEKRDKQQYEEAQRRLEEARQHQQQQQVQPQPASTQPAGHVGMQQPGTPTSGTLGTTAGQPGTLGGQPRLGGTEVPPAGGTALGAGAGAGMSLTGSHDGVSGASSSDYQTYTVKKGDTLTGIAHHFFGRASAYEEILAANRGTLRDADHIREGQVLRIPRRRGGQLA